MWTNAGLDGLHPNTQSVDHVLRNAEHWIYVTEGARDNREGACVPVLFVILWGRIGGFYRGCSGVATGLLQPCEKGKPSKAEECVEWVGAVAGTIADTTSFRVLAGKDKFGQLFGIYPLQTTEDCQ